MDLLENQFHRHPMPRRIAAFGLDAVTMIEKKQKPKADWRKRADALTKQQAAWVANSSSIPVSIGGAQGVQASLGKVIGPSFAADEVPDVLEALIETYLRERHGSGEHRDQFLHCVPSRRGRFSAQRGGRANHVAVRPFNLRRAASIPRRAATARKSGQSAHH